MPLAGRDQGLRQGSGHRVAAPPWGGLGGRLSRCIYSYDDDFESDSLFVLSVNYVCRVASRFGVSWRWDTDNDKDETPHYQIPLHPTPSSVYTGTQANCIHTSCKSSSTHTHTHELVTRPSSSPSNGHCSRRTSFVCAAAPKSCRAVPGKVTCKAAWMAFPSDLLEADSDTSLNFASSHGHACMRTSPFCEPRSGGMAVRGR